VAKIPFCCRNGHIPLFGDHLAREGQVGEGVSPISCLKFEIECYLARARSASCLWIPMPALPIWFIYFQF
jgi:hypothetical protein